MDLFNQNSNQPESLSRPLSERIRPQSFKDLLLGESVKLKLAFLKTGSFNISFILYGPPGVGKTSIMKVVEAKSAESGFLSLWINAVDVSVKDLRGCCSEAREAFLIQSRKTIIFIDEIHRLSKAQQDVLLPSVESGEVVLVGATTENPKISLNRPLVSRCRVVKLSGVLASSMKELCLRSAIELGYKSIGDFIDSKALSSLIDYCLGDGRKLVGLLESLSVQVSSFPIKTKDLALISTDERMVPLSSAQFKVENTSALIKTLRGSDLEAALIYLIRLVEGGVDPIYIYRRFLIFASEDIGNADPQALVLVQSSKQAFEAIGMPEGYYNLVQTLEYLANAPKSRESVRLLAKSKEAAWKTMDESPPAHLLIKGSGAKDKENLPKSNIYGFLL